MSTKSVGRDGVRKWQLGLRRRISDCCGEEDKGGEKGDGRAVDVEVQPLVATRAERTVKLKMLYYIDFFKKEGAVEF